MDLRFEKDLAGIICTSLGGTASVYSLTPFANGQLGIVQGDYPARTRVTLTGWYYVDSVGTLFRQTTGENFIVYEDGWDLGYISQQISAGDAQRIIDGIINNNKHILENNLLCARYANLLSADDRRTLEILNTRLRIRDEALHEPELLGRINTSYPPGFANLGSYLQKYAPVIGVVITSAAVIVVSAVVVASLATAVYFAYRAYYSESEADVKYSDRLTKTLQAKLTEKEYQELMRETNGIVTRERIRQQLNMFGGMGKNILLLLAGAFIVLRAPKWIDAVQSKPAATKSAKLLK